MEWKLDKTHEIELARKRQKSYKERQKARGKKIFSMWLPLSYFSPLNEKIKELDAAHLSKDS
jgi:hypothetical protein